ncbi:response regulator [Magnetofaba australis]|uniref:Putative two component transcriptional regulator n=1 Tax=Magnetofaba australis IT-1 TaxID=1434232 RepID=A0A1Y2K403_9PROT|nr:response regulator [Magnetofaba australis]OSM04135.1 putative two component transcriptional regulator [Magnetofaba australis IT-1]
MSDQDRIVVVEDDDEIRTLLREYLCENQCHVRDFADGQGMWAALREDDRVDVIVLDLMLPGEDGLTLCKRLSIDPATQDIPVIMLTARRGETDRIIGLEMGADDYLTKPFSPRELLARIHSVLRRSRAMPRDNHPREPREYRFAGWKLDVKAQRLTSPGGVDVTLTSGEFIMLLAFLKHPSEVLNRDQIMEAYRNRESSIFERSIDVQVGRVRRRLQDDPKEPKIIKTVWGKGYILDCRVDVS